MQAQIAANAVIQMHHRGANVEVAELGDNLVGVGLPVLAAAVLRGALAEYLAFDNHRYRRLVQHQAALHRRHRNADAILAVDEVPPAVAGAGENTVAAQQLVQHFPAAGGFGDKQDAAIETLDIARQRRGRLLALRLQVQFGRRLAVEIEGGVGAFVF